MATSNYRFSNPNEAMIEAQRRIAIARSLRDEEVDLTALGLVELPSSLNDLPNLQRLYVHRNAIEFPPEVIGPDWFDVRIRKKNPARAKDILAYYAKTRAGRRPLNEGKLIFVGRGGAGKTSLINRLLHERFNPDEKMTEGICISKWQVRLSESDYVHLNLWDFGGQEIMHATHQFFLTQRSLYVLVIEGRQSREDEEAEYWLKLIQSFATEDTGEVSPVLVVLNKIKACAFELNQPALRQKYQFIRGFIATDCQDGTGLRELKETIESETRRLKHIRAIFPETWFRIKDSLAQMKSDVSRPFVTYDEFRRICITHGEETPREQDLLASYLHNLGIALNYKDDPRLRDTHVLDPQWVTNGIYTILNSSRLKSRRGELCLEDATEILDCTAYPRSMHRFLFDLMRKFSLCFPFPDDDSRYLIPELLDNQEPEVSGFQLCDCLNFEYRYSVLPEGLMPRFIVRTHALSVERPRWRSGVALAFEGNSALVKADFDQKRVVISVNGPLSGRRRLLGIIRSDLERIHVSINKFQPTAFVPLPEFPGEIIAYDDLLAFERAHERQLKKPIKGRLETLDVQKLLDGVDLDGARRSEDAPRHRPINVFYSYSHKDERYRDQLENHLKLLLRRGFISEWHDRKIDPGAPWEGSIDVELDRADIILLLVSPHFIASDYCYEKELKRALERHRVGSAQVIPIILRSVVWRTSDLAMLLALPKDGKPVLSWSDRDKAWRDVSEGIEKVVNAIRNRPTSDQNRD